MFLIIAVIVITTILISYCYWKLTFWQRQGVPTPGLMYQWHYYTRELAKYDQELHRQLGPLYGTYEGLSPILIVGDPELVREVLIKEFAKFPNHKSFKLGDPTIDNNMFALDGNEDWKRIRSIISPSFTSGKLRGMSPLVISGVNKLVEKLDAAAEIGEPVDLIPKLRSLTFDVLLRCAYGVEVDTYTTSTNNPIAQNLYAIFSTRYSALFSLLFPRFTKLVGIQDMALKPFRFFIELTDTLIKERKEMKAGSALNSDLLQLMLDANKDAGSNGKSLSDLEIKAQSLVFLVAGFHATSVTIALALYQLALHPDIQERLYEEVSEFDTVDASESLKYLEAVIKESLRLNSPVVRVERQCVQKHQLGNATVLPGTTVSITTFPIHLDPKSYSDPKTFKPERFLENGSEVNHSPSAFLPFGGGPRICIAQRFALMQAKYTLVKLVQQFRFETTHKTELSFNCATFDSLDPKEIYLRITKR